MAMLTHIKDRLYSGLNNGFNNGLNNGLNNDAGVNYSFTPGTDMDYLMQHRSLGLATVVKELLSEGCNILDLGPLCSGTTESFLRLGCTCYVEDLIEYLESLSSDGQDAIQKLGDHLLPKPESLKFDVVLCWDLLNFLRLDTIAFLMEKLSPHFKSGTVLHAMRYVGPQPARPKRFKLLSDFTYQILGDAYRVQIAATSHSTAALLKHMRQFSLRNTLINQEGMSQHIAELLLEFDARGSQKQLRKKTQSNTVHYFSDRQSGSDLPCKGLGKVLAYLEAKNASILELGKSAGKKNAYLSNAAFDVYAEDVFSSIYWQNKVNGQNRDRLSETLLHFSDQVNFDLVLAWDLFNFCMPFQIAKIGQLLSAHLHSDGFLHFILFNTRGTPKKPAVFDIQADYSVTVSGAVAGDGSRPVDSAAALLKLLPQFKLLIHNVGKLNRSVDYQEFLLKLQR